MPVLDWIWVEMLSKVSEFGDAGGIYGGDGDGRARGIGNV